MRCPFHFLASPLSPSFGCHPPPLSCLTRSARKVLLSPIRTKGQRGSIDRPTNELRKKRLSRVGSKGETQPSFFFPRPARDRMRGANFRLCPFAIYGILRLSRPLSVFSIEIPNADMHPTSTFSLTCFSFPPTSVSPIRFLFSQRSLLMDNFHFFAYALSTPPNKCLCMQIPSFSATANPISFLSMRKKGQMCASFSDRIPIFGDEECVTHQKLIRTPTPPPFRHI